MNKIQTLMVAACAFSVGIGINNFAMSDVPANYKVGVVDIQQIVTNSSQVKALKTEQEGKAKEMVSFIETARKTVADEKNAEKKAQLEDKYNKEFATKRANLEKNYAKKLQSIDKNISSIIQKEAKAQKFNLVLAKGVVLYGGEDITTSISKLVK